MAASEGYRELGEAAWSWVLRHVREDDGPWLPDSVADGWQGRGPADDRDSLYCGIAGLAPVLAEIAQSRSLTSVEQGLSVAIAGRLTREAAQRIEPSLYDGLAGDATALKLLGDGGESLALQRLADLRTPTGWPTTSVFWGGPDATLTDVIGGSAGVVMAALWVGGAPSASIATTGCDALLDAADRTEAGLDWSTVPGSASRGPNYSHGTAGVAAALAVAGAELSRADYVEAALQGARHLLAVGSLADNGFIVPHTIPPSTREVEPVTYTWCHGPAGTSHVFAALAKAGVPSVSGIDVAELRQRCLTSILSSGVPQRLRPGFWDNDGRCCGTAGVGDVLLDGYQDCPDPARAQTLLAGARGMGDALVNRAIRDGDGARWRFVEHRQDPPLLPPGTSWMQGAAGISAFLLRLDRVLRDGADAPVVDRPDQWWAVPARLRTGH